MSISSLVEGKDKFKVDETAPFFEISPTGSYGSFSSGLKNEYVLKFKDLETKNVIKKSGILSSNSNKITKVPSRTILTFSEQPAVPGSFFGWSEIYWVPDPSLPGWNWKAFIQKEATQLKGLFPYQDLTDKLSSVTVGNLVTLIGEFAFKNCESLTSIEISDSVRAIGNEAFKGCTSLTSIEIPYSVNDIGVEAFTGCTSLTSVTLPNAGLNTIYRTFADCTSLKSITIPVTVFFMGNDSFVNTDLETVIIPYPNPLGVISPASNVYFYGKAGVEIILPTS